MAAKSKRKSEKSAVGVKQSTRSGSARSGSGGGPFRRKSCQLCKAKATDVDYKNVALLRRYISERGKIRPRRMSGACRKHQRLVAVAVKRAREMALLPYIAKERQVETPRSPSRPRDERER